jgi:hypothetical protein
LRQSVSLVTQRLKDLGAAVRSGNLFVLEAHVSVTGEQLMYRFFFRVCLVVLAIITLDARIEASAQQPVRKPSAPNARIFFVDLKDGATVPSKLKIRFGIENMEVAPAGTVKPNTGHHHLLIDTGLPPLDQPIPSDFNHIHFGGGQIEAEITLPAGEHTLQLLLGDQSHIPHQPPVFSEVIHVRVDPATVEKARTPAPAGAGVFFVEPADGATVGRKLTVKFGISGMELVPAGTSKPNSGHHHLLIDAPLPAFDREIPSDLNHVHFGRAQTEAEINLTPGDHTLQLLLGDHEHIAHDPPVFSKVIHIHVADAAPDKAPPQAAAADGRRPSPPDAAVYFIYPGNGERIYPNSTIRFGLRNMGVAPAGVFKPNTGHHHLMIDVETPPLDRPLPSDLNHIHFGNGQTEKKITLSPGEHTLQLILADEKHMPHDPPVISERIKVTVKAAVRPPARRRFRR